MSIEKLSDASRLQREDSPYAQILNTITEYIKDNDAFRLYCFLYSKSSDWEVRKAYTSEVCGVAASKAKKCWSYLNRCGLIDYVPVKDEKGHYLKHDVRVLNGTKFNKDEPFLSTQAANSSSGRNSHPVDKPHDWESTPLENDPLLKKDSYQETKSKKKERAAPSGNSYCPGIHELIFSDEALKAGNEKNLDMIKTGYAFMNYAKSNGWLRTDWKAAFLKWVLDERTIAAPKHVTNSPFADVTRQSTSAKPFDPDAPLAPPSPILEQFMKSKQSKAG